MMSLQIDGHERRCVGTGDIPAAYLHAYEKDFTILKFTGESVDILCQTDSSYKKFVTIENGRKVIYVKLKKALYGCVTSALLWYELFTDTLKKMGFELNEYEPCIANKIINGKQCTIVWYVDDVKVSHDDEKVVDEIFDSMNKKFGNLKPKKGKKHEYLGMDIVFRDDGTVSIDMSKHVNEVIEVFSKESPVTSKATTPALRNLFEVNEKSPRLDDKRSAVFHHCVAKMLYVSNRCRLDTSLAVSFLCTRVTYSTEQDWLKLKRLVRYLYGTKERVLIIGANDVTTVNIYIDAAYAVHNNMRSHTGGCITFGRGIIMPKSTKQKLNTKSSTEAELVACSEYIQSAIYARLFLQAQGYELSPSIVNQDNQSTILLLKNGRSSCGKQSRHVDIRYFFMKDRIDKGQFKVEYCPTELMIADFFTKPLQGGLFKRLSEVVMGEIDIASFLKQYSNKDEDVQKNHNHDESKERVEPSDYLTGNTQNDDVKIDVNSTLGSEINKKVSFADVVRRGITTDSSG